MLTLLRKPFEWIGVLSTVSDDFTEEELALARTVDERLREDPIVFKEYKGYVTQITNNAVELDHRWTYVLDVDDRFGVGDRVAYKVFRTRNDPVVQEVVLLNEREHILEKELSGVILDVVDGIYTVSNGVTFDKHKVKVTVELFKSDHVVLVGDYPKDQDDPTAFDLDLKFFTLKKVLPAKTKLMTGSIVSFNPQTNMGIIGNGQAFVRFHRNMCNIAAVPDQGASVACNAIETQPDESGTSWRAIEVWAVPAKPLNTRRFLQVDSVPRFQLVIGETKTIELGVSNQGKFNANILDIEVTSKNNAARLLNLDYIKVIQPKTTRVASVEVVGHKLGSDAVRMKWILVNPRKNLVINTSFSFNVVTQGHNDNEGSSIRDSLPNKRFIPGVSRRMGPIFRKVPLKDYSIPQSLRDLPEPFSSVSILDMEIALRKEKQCLAEDLSETNYGEWMHTLLFLEEIEYARAYEQLATQNFLYRKGDYITFGFPVDSKYSQLVVGDSMYANKPWEEQITYEGKIWEVSQTQVSCKFHPQFSNTMRGGAKYDLHFKMNRMQFRKRHQGVDLVLQNIGAEWLFPSTSPSEGDYPDGRKPEMSFNWINPRLNLQQKTAVRNILAKGNLPYPYVIYGPPGTGKTMTVLEAILQVYTTVPDCRILVAAPTNSAVDTVGVRLLSFGVVQKEDMVRLTGYNAYKQGIVAVELADISFMPNLSEASSEQLVPEEDEAPPPTINLNDLGKHKITIGTTTTLATLNSVGLAQGFFTHVIIDEAGQCTEPETLLPIALIDPKMTQLVLAGDPKQLGPQVRSVLAKKYSFHRSFLDRLTSTYPYKKKFDEFEDFNGYNPLLITKLVYNYRSLPQIVKLIGESFYDNELLPVKSSRASREAEILQKLSILNFDLGPDRHSLLFINVSSREEQERDNFSYFNSGEVMQVLNCLTCLYDKHVSPDDIGVITPYSLQVRKIFALLDSLKIVSPKIASVEEFQGQERDVIILSLVRNNLGTSRHVSNFVTDSQRVNVALSRARLLNVIIGNRQTLCAQHQWSNIIAQCHVINIPFIEENTN